MEYLNPLRFLIKSFRTPLDSKLDVTLFSIISKTLNKLKNGGRFSTLFISKTTISGETYPPAPLTGFSFNHLAETFGVGENPSGNAYCSARGLATIGAAMANRGVFKGSKERTDFQDF